MQSTRYDHPDDSLFGVARALLSAKAIFIRLHLGGEKDTKSIEMADTLSSTS